MSQHPRADESLDILLRGRVRLLQSRKGYRTSVDAMLLAWFAHRQRPLAARVADLGAGSGLVGITLALAHPTRQVTLVERQPQLAERAARNTLLNGLGGRVAVVHHDLVDGDVPEATGLDLVVSNPPYFSRHGRILPSHPERRDAHYETTAGVEVFAQRAAACLGPAGAVCMVFPAEFTARLVRAFDAAGLGRMRLLHVHHRTTAAAPTRALLAGGLGETDVVTLPPATLHQPGLPDHTYHADIEAFIAALTAHQPAPARVETRPARGG